MSFLLKTGVKVEVYTPSGPNAGTVVYRGVVIDCRYSSIDGYEYSILCDDGTIVESSWVREQM